MINDQFICCFANNKHLQWERYEFKGRLKLITIHYNNPSKSMRTKYGSTQQGKESFENVLNSYKRPNNL